MMAKFAQVGYGSKGDGIGKTENGYIYVVNDNVRTGATIYPSVIHAKSGKIFGTTGKVLGTTKQRTTETEKLEDQGKMAYIETGKQMGIQHVRGKEPGQWLPTFQKDKGTHDPVTGEYKAGIYEMASRGGNILLRQQQNAMAEISQSQKATKALETFESYSKKFMGGQE